jgi:hypothetical protein
LSSFFHFIRLSVGRTGGTETITDLLGPEAIDFVWTGKSKKKKGAIVGGVIGGVLIGGLTFLAGAAGAAGCEYDCADDITYVVTYPLIGLTLGAATGALIGVGIGALGSDERLVYAGEVIPITYKVLSRREHIRVTVHDLSGTQLRLLVDQVQARGRREVIWNGRDDEGHRVASGKYVVRVETSEGIHSLNADVEW